MMRERLQRLAKTVRNVGAVVFLLVALLLAQLLFAPIRMGEEDAGDEVAPKPSRLSAEIDRTRAALAVLAWKLSAGELDVKTFRRAQYSALLHLAEVARDTPTRDMSDREFAVAYFTDLVLTAREKLAGEPADAVEPASLGLAWAVTEDDARDIPERLRYEFFPDTTERYLDDMRLVGETGLFAVPGSVARELGFADYAAWRQAARNDEGLYDEGLNRMAREVRILLEDYPEADARLAFWGISPRTATPQAENILLRLRTSRGVR